MPENLEIVHKLGQKKMDNSLVSIVMPTYNHAPFIAEAIDSVIKQSYENFELIIVDNFSQDNTEEIVHSFKDSRIKYYKYSNHGIIAASRNHGIEQSCGKYIAFIDSDDSWFKDKLKQAIMVFEKDAQVGLTFCRFQVHDPKGDDHGKILGPKISCMEGDIYNQLLNSNFIVASSVVVRKSILNVTGGFDEAQEFRCAEDFDLWLRIAKYNKIIFIPEVQGTYRMHSLNCNVDTQKLQKALNVINKHFKQGWATKRVVNRAKANFYFREGWFLIDADVYRARSYFQKAIRLDFQNLKMLSLNLMGLLCSALPSVYKFITCQNLDKKIGCKIINPQNI